MVIIDGLWGVMDMLLGSVWESAEFAIGGVGTSRVGVWIGKNECCWRGFLVRLGGMRRSCVHDGMDNPLNEMLMHRSRLLQIITPPTKRANYFNAWTCSSHMPMGRPIRIRNKARTKNHWWTKLINLYYIGNSGSGECILVLFGPLLPNLVCFI